MGGSIETFEFKKIECESKYDLNLKKNGIRLNVKVNMIWI